MSAIQIVRKQVKVPPGLNGRAVIETLPPKLAKRAVLSQNQHRRRIKRKAEKDYALRRNEMFGEIKQRYAMTRVQIHNERTWRREDYVKGPLAPKRDIGALAETFGSIHVSQLYDVEKLPGWVKRWGIAVGDRVCITARNHRDKGKIGVVREVREKAEEVIVTGLNMVEVEIPKYMLIKESDKTPIRPFEKPLKLSDVRLVAPVLDPIDNRLRDHIIEKLDFKWITKRERQGVDPPTRVVAGVLPLQVIAYPKKEEPAEEDRDIDTLRIEVDEKTWVPTMHMPPMPPGVIDELRNKFSKFRIRHDDEYIEKLEKEERKEVRKLRMTNKMMTPLKQKRRIERKERKALGEPTLSDEMLANIGQFMARKMGEEANEEEDKASSNTPQATDEPSEVRADSTAMAYEPLDEGVHTEPVRREAVSGSVDSTPLSDEAIRASDDSASLNADSAKDSSEESRSTKTPTS